MIENFNNCNHLETQHDSVTGTLETNATQSLFEFERSPRNFSVNKLLSYYKLLLHVAVIVKFLLVSSDDTNKSFIFLVREKENV